MKKLCHLREYGQENKKFERDKNKMRCPGEDNKYNDVMELRR